MRFATIALATGLVGALLAANVQGTPSSSVAEAASFPPADGIDVIETGSIPTAGASGATAVRLIDLRNGTTCRTALSAAPSRDVASVASAATTAGETSGGEVSFGGACGRLPFLARISQWRSGLDGSLVLSDGAGARILEFAPGDGVLFESVYPDDQLITIVPARG